VQKFDTEGFNLKRLNVVEVKEQYQIKISNKFPAMEDLDDEDEGNVDGSGGDRARESIRENIKASAAQSRLL
jgi:hypothetical protein